ncbi:MAG: serine/threonine protein kinase, partial [Streptomycetaceae bacterium]|nr:serine/threonine protein kinase [Streptomycetaceae bacterium]
MGEVWQGVDRELGRTVAIKVLPAELTRHDEFRTRFRREARTVASLSHQGVATLYDVGEDVGDGGEAGDTTPFLVMEFVDGRTLADALRDGPVPAERALAIARDVADALVHSHGHGLVHRDIKPSNVMLTATGSIKVLDFGIAKALAETTTRLTATGMTVGTPAYLSPEQIDGGAVDGRSDLYSLGCLLYELLAGKPPFSGDSPFVVMNQHLVKEPSPPSALRPQIPAEVDALVLRLLAKSPGQRPASAAELRGDLDALQARLRDGSAPGGTRPAPPPAPA